MGEIVKTNGKKNKVWLWIGGVLIAFVILGQIGGSNNLNDESNLITKEKLGDQWPLKDVSEGRVECIDGQYIVFVTNQGTYAINGTANSAAKKMGWHKSDEIHIPGKDIRPILQKGLELCQ